MQIESVASVIPVNKSEQVIMLKYRILTAIILIPLFLLLLFKLPAGWFCFVTGVVVVLGAWEWSSLMGVKRFAYKLIYPLLMAAILFAAMWLYIPNVIIAASVWWLFGLLLVAIYPKASISWGEGVLARGLMGVMVLVPCWLAINFIRNIPDNGISILLFLFVIIWGADTGAYFAGRFWGKHKLAPAVSPGKTWQGVMGALVITLIITCGALIWIAAPYKMWFGVCLTTIITVLFSIVGDLFESMLKRKENLKDSGHLLPGHGGILDRIDSLTAAAPIFLFGALFLQKIFA
jgi:phosphatidate cytidylyltransferase